jgi:hypothetical protein
MTGLGTPGPGVPVAGLRRFGWHKPADVFDGISTVAKPVILRGQSRIGIRGEHA